MVSINKKARKQAPFATITAKKNNDGLRVEKKS